MNNSNRPATINTANFPEPIAASMQAAADRKWCWVTVDGSTFYVNEESKARANQKAKGGAVFAPVA